MEDVFNINYNTKLDKLEIAKEKRTHKIFKLIKKNKFISLIFASFIFLSLMNFYLIYSFVKILESIWNIYNNIGGGSMSSKYPVLPPMHSEIARGTLKSILEQADIELEEFLKNL